MFTNDGIFVLLNAKVEVTARVAYIILDLPQVVLFICAKQVTDERRSREASDEVARRLDSRLTGLPQKRTLRKSNIIRIARITFLKIHTQRIVCLPVRALFP